MAIEFHMIWRDQIRAVSAIRQRHGEEAAFDYIVDEKLMNFAEAAEGRPESPVVLPQPPQSSSASRRRCNRRRLLRRAVVGLPILPGSDPARSCETRWPWRLIPR